MTTFRSLIGIAAVAVALTPAAASAADHSGAIGVDHPEFAWDSKLGTGFTAVSNLHDKVPCATPVIHDCDYALVEVTGPGSVAISSASTDPNAVDADLYVYDSDAQGSKGDQIAYSAASDATPNEATAVDVPDGVSYLLVEIEYTVNLAGTIHGKAVFTPAPPEPPAGDGSV